MINFRAILHFLGPIWIILGIAILFCLIPAYIYHEGEFVSLLAIGLTIISMGTLSLLLTRKGEEIRIREAQFSVFSAWISACLIGAVPFIVIAKMGLVDAFFEAVSGFTTTGASVINDVEALPHGLLFWRSLTHWLGGMGIVVMSITILPLLGYGGMELFRIEAVGPLKEKFTPRVRNTARILWGTYVIITIVQITLLYVGGMNLYDAMCHAFGAIATGGFSTKNTGILYFNSHFINWVIIFSMLSGATNFYLHYSALRGRPLIYFKDPEFRFWLSFLFIAIILIIIINLWHNPNIHIHNFIDNIGGVGKVIEDSAFIAVSLSSTTGFALADYNEWNHAAQFILVVLMLFGSCAGSTCGAIKIMRLMVLYKAIRLEVRKLIHPHAVFQVHIGEKLVSTDTVRAIFMFTVAYFGMVGIGIFILMFFGLDWASAIGGVVACAGGVGPGLGVLGPSTTYYVLPAVSKLTLCLEMLLGRFEIYAFIVVFSRGFWRA
jgi:trk system potassium uptake protein TrkH